MYSFGLKVVIFSSLVFFLTEECSQKKDPSQYQREDSLIRYKQLDHKNRLVSKPLSDYELLNKHDQRHHKNVSKECPATLSYGQDKALWGKNLCVLKKMDSLGFIIYWPEERKKHIKSDLYKSVISKLDQRYITEYINSGYTIKTDENGCDGKFFSLNANTDSIDIERLEKDFFQNWNQGVDYLLDNKNDHNKALPFLKAAVDVDNGYYSKFAVLALYKLANNVDATLSLLKEKTAYSLMNYYKTKEALSPQELDWCFLYNKLMLTLFKKDDLFVNRTLIYDLNHPETALFDVVFNDKLKKNSSVFNCLMSGHLLKTDDEKYRQQEFVKSVRKYINEDTLHSLDWVWAAILFAQSAYAESCVESLFNNKNRNDLFEHVNPILYHNGPYFRMFFNKDHISYIKNFLGKNSSSYENKILLTLCNIFSVCASFSLKEKAENCTIHGELKDQSINESLSDSKELDRCCMDAYKKTLLTIFGQCNTKDYCGLKAYKSKRIIIEEWINSLKNAIGAFLDKNDLLTYQDTEKNPELGFRQSQVFEVVASMYWIDDNIKKNKNQNQLVIQMQKKFSPRYRDLCKKSNELNYLFKNVLVCSPGYFRDKNKYCLDVFNDSIDLLVCSPAVFCKKIIDLKAVYPYYVIKMREMLKDDKKCFADLQQLENEYPNDISSEDRDVADCMLLSLMGTAIDPKYRCYFAFDKKEHYNKVKDRMLYVVSLLSEKNGFDLFPRLIFDRTVSSMSYIANQEKGMSLILAPIIEEMNKRFIEITTGNQCKNLFESIEKAVAKNIVDEIKNKLSKNNKNIRKKK